MLVPPLALLCLLGAAALVPALAAALYGHPWPAVLLLASFALAIVALGAALDSVGKDHAPWRALLRAPFYVLWKTPLYVGLDLVAQARVEPNPPG